MFTFWDYNYLARGLPIRGVRTTKTAMDHLNCGNRGFSMFPEVHEYFEKAYTNAKQP